MLKVQGRNIFVAAAQKMLKNSKKKHFLPAAQNVSHAVKILTNFFTCLIQWV